VKIYIILMILFGIGYAGVYTLATTELRRLIGPRFVIWYALIILAGFYVPSGQIFLLVSVVVTLATVQGRVDAVCRYILAIMLLPNVLWRASIGSAYICDLDVQNVLGLTLLVVCMVSRSRVPARRAFTLEDWFIVALIAIFWIAKTRFPALSLFARDGVQTSLSLLLPYILFRRNIRSMDEYRLLLGSFVAASAILAVFAIYEARFGWALFGTMEHRLFPGEMVSKSMLQRGGAMRASTTMSGPLMLAFLFLVSVVATFAVRPLVRTQALWTGLLGLLFLGLLTTQSRGNLACLGVGFVVYCLARRKYGLAALAMMGAAAGAMVIIVGARVSSTLANFVNPSQPTADGHYDYRGLLLQRGLEEGMKYPLTGTSLNFVYDRLEDITQGQHIVDLVNTYLTIFLMSGLIGFVPFVGIILAIIYKQIVGYPRVKDVGLLTVRAVVITLFVILLIELSFMSFFDRMPSIMMLILVGSRMIEFERRALLRGKSPERTTPAAVPTDYGDLPRRPGRDRPVTAAT
jgi:hypothetical protein